MTNLRKLARNRECQVRLPLCCNFDPTTTVLAHIRLQGLGSGAGIKSPDLFGAWACSNCHTWVDTHHDESTTVAFYEGVFRTQAQLLKEGVL